MPVDDQAGREPVVGQFLVAIDPTVFSGGAFSERLELLIGTILGQEGTRLPGASRLAQRAASVRDGVRIPVSLHDELMALSARA